MLKVFSLRTGYSRQANNTLTHAADLQPEQPVAVLAQTLGVTMFVPLSWNNLPASLSFVAASDVCVLPTATFSDCFEEQPFGVATL